MYLGRLLIIAGRGEKVLILINYLCFIMFFWLKEVVLIKLLNELHYYPYFLMHSIMLFLFF